MYHNPLDAIAQSIAGKRANVIINHKLTGGHLMKAIDLQLVPTPIRDIPVADRKPHLWQVHCDAVTDEGNALYRFTNAFDGKAMAIDPKNPRGGVLFQDPRPGDENSPEAFAQRWFLDPTSEGTYNIRPFSTPDHLLGTENKDLKNSGCFRGLPDDEGDVSGHIHGVTFNTEGGQKDPKCNTRRSSNTQGTAGH